MTMRLAAKWRCSVKRLALAANLDKAAGRDGAEDYGRQKVLEQGDGVFTQAQIIEAASTRNGRNDRTSMAIP
jgi:hypothetical protein